MLLFRPVGLNELRLIADAGFRAFPPRLPEQPIFYPVLNVEYARKIARDWNTKDEPYAGFVTQFAVDDGFVKRYAVQTVGARVHQELWVPAEDLDDFNENLTSPIEVIEYFTGPKFAGTIDPATRLPTGWQASVGPARSRSSRPAGKLDPAADLPEDQSKGPRTDTRSIIDRVRDGEPKQSSHCRLALCTSCGAQAWHVLHGYTIRGELWKGHACACGTWHCTACDRLMSTTRPCCR